MGRPFLVAFSSANFTGANDSNENPIFDTGLDTFTLMASTAYVMSGHIHIHTTGTNAHTLAISFAGTATLTSIGYGAWATYAATEALSGADSIWVSSASATVITPSKSTATHHTILIHGIVRINGAGT